MRIAGASTPSPRVRGESRGEGLFRKSELVEAPPHPDLLPASGEKEHKRCGDMQIGLSGAREVLRRFHDLWYDSRFPGPAAKGDVIR